MNLSVETFRKLCGADAWCQKMATFRPITNLSEMHRVADQVFDELSDDDWLEAFSCHPKIGDVDSLRMKFAGNRQWSAGEQSGMSEADERTIELLADGNRDYESRFGYIFIVCASGKSAAEMLGLLQSRIQNDAKTELQIAASEQRKITHVRIDKLIQSETPMRSPITSHILDTAKGRPAAGIRVELYSLRNGDRKKIGEGISDDDGRVASGLIEPADFQPGMFQIRFEVDSYFKTSGDESFFPEVTITFNVTAGQSHYHVPLLLSAFGYTTYRGS